jgi:uncharacterized protein YndB with AHSA1/START domain
MNDSDGGRLLGTLGADRGTGVVRMEDRFETDIDDVWSALTTPERLARWVGEFEGDLRVGGTYHYYFTASGAEGTGRVEECEPPRRLRLSHGIEQQDAHTIEVELREDGDRTVLVVEERGIPLGQLAGYGAGIQIHVEDLGAHLEGRRPDGDTDNRWDRLEPRYQPFADEVTR